MFISPTPISIPVWKTAPCLRPCLALMAGCIFGERIHQSLTLSYLAFGLVTLILLSISLLLHTKIARRNQALVITGLFVLLGVLRSGLQREAAGKNFIGDVYKAHIYFMAELLEPPVEKQNSFKAEAKIALLDSNTKTWQPVRGHAILYFDKKSFCLNYGSQVIAGVPLNPIKNAGNPGGFDYRKYAGHHHLYVQSFIKSEQYRLVAQKGTVFWKKLYAIRAGVLKALGRYIPNKQALGVAEALLIGYKGDLDKEITELFAATGTAHIIAISGMHLGMIYGLLLALFKPFRNTSRLRILSAVTILCCLWAFTLLTGAEASITRAALMFSLITLGDLVRRKSPSYNQMAIAIILLLLQNPNNIFDVGFQLSFAAVLSIAVFYQPILHLWVPTAYILQKIWSLLAISLAAQLFTLPFIVYHFHQFPVYFLLANLVAVPLSGLALYGLIILLLLQPFPALCHWVGLAVQNFIFGMNVCMASISKWPMANISQIQISISQAVWLMGIIIFTALIWLRPKSKLVYGLLTCTLLFGAEFAYSHWKFKQQNQIIVYNIPQHTGIDFVRGSQAYFVGDSVLMENGFMQNFHLLPSRIYNRFHVSQYRLLKPDGNYEIAFQGKSIGVFREPLNNLPPSPQKYDCVVLGAGMKYNPETFFKIAHSPTIIVAGFLSDAKKSRWLKAADSLHLRLHFLASEGAYTARWPPNAP